MREFRKRVAPQTLFQFREVELLRSCIFCCNFLALQCFSDISPNAGSLERETGKCPRSDAKLIVASKGEKKKRMSQRMGAERVRTRMRDTVKSALPYTRAVKSAREHESLKTSQIKMQHLPACIPLARKVNGDIRW